MFIYLEIVKTEYIPKMRITIMIGCSKCKSTVKLNLLSENFYLHARQMLYVLLLTMYVNTQYNL